MGEENKESPTPPTPPTPSEPSKPPTRESEPDSAPKGGPTASFGWLFLLVAIGGVLYWIVQREGRDGSSNG